MYFLSAFFPIKIRNIIGSHSIKPIPVFVRILIVRLVAFVKISESDKKSIGRIKISEILFFSKGKGASLPVEQ